MKKLFRTSLFLAIAFILWLVVSCTISTKKNQPNETQSIKQQSEFLEDMRINAKVYNTDSLARVLTRDSLCNIVVANFDKEDSIFYLTTFPPFQSSDTAKSQAYFGNFCVRHKLGYALNINKFIFLKILEINEKVGSAKTEVFYQMVPYNSRYFDEMAKMPNSVILQN